MLSHFRCRIDGLTVTENLRFRFCGSLAYELTGDLQAVTIEGLYQNLDRLGPTFLTFYDKANGDRASCYSSCISNGNSTSQCNAACSWR